MLRNACIFTAGALFHIGLTAYNEIPDNSKDGSAWFIWFVAGMLILFGYAFGGKEETGGGR